MPRKAEPHTCCFWLTGETLNNLILNSPQEWQTGVALPFVRIQGKPGHLLLYTLCLFCVSFAYVGSGVL